MPRRTDFPSTERLAFLADLLALKDNSETGSETAMSRCFARLLERVCEGLGLNGAGLFVQKGKTIRLVAKHGIDAAGLAEIQEHMEASAPQPGQGQAAGTPGTAGSTCLPSRSSSTRYTIYTGRVDDSTRVVSAFGMGEDATGDLIAVLSLVAANVALHVTAMVLKEEIATSAARTEKIARELREMQVCSLNIMEDLQKKNRDLAMLNRLSNQLTSCTSMPELASTAAEAISAAFDGACVSLYLTKPTGYAFAPFHTTGDIVGDADNLCVEVSSDLGAQLAAGHEITFDSAIRPSEFPLAAAVSAKSGLLVPLRSKASIVGFLAVCETRWHRVFTDDEKDNLRVLAGTLSVAVENANLISRRAAQVEEMHFLTDYIETVVDSVDLAVMVVGADLKIGMINKGFERIYGQSREQFVGRHIYEAFPYLIDQGFEAIAQQVLEGKPFTRFGWKRKAFGREVVQNMRIFPHRSAAGDIIGAIVIIEDVTEKADLETQLARSEAKFRNLVEDLGDGYLIVTGGEIVYANKAATQLTAIPAPEILGMDVGRILPYDDIQAECREPGGKKIWRESKLVHSTGTWIPVEVTLAPCAYEGDQSVSLVITDITERRKFEKQLELKNREMAVRNEQVTRLNLELEATVNKLKESQENLIKSERLAAITETSVAANHEINNPLFSILGQAQLLLRKYRDQDEDTQQRLKTIEESALRIACVTKKLANLAEPVVKEYVGLPTSMIDVDKSTSR